MRASLVVVSKCRQSGEDIKVAASSPRRVKAELSALSSSNGRVDTPGMRPRVTIGDFSRASHLSVKTLRHYHEVGLLEPSEVDPDNGYRYYSEDQIPLAQVIRRLRGLQMPVADVKSVLAAPDSDTRKRLILERVDRLERELAQTREAVGELRDLLEPQASHAIERRTVDATPAIGIQQTVDRDDLFGWWQGALGELHATSRRRASSRVGQPEACMRATSFNTAAA